MTTVCSRTTAQIRPRLTLGGAGRRTWRVVSGSVVSGSSTSNADSDHGSDRGAHAGSPRSAAAETATDSRSFDESTVGPRTAAGAVSDVGVGRPGSAPTSGEEAARPESEGKDGTGAADRARSTTASRTPDAGLGDSIEGDFTGAAW